MLLSVHEGLTPVTVKPPPYTTQQPLPPPELLPTSETFSVETASMDEFNSLKKQLLESEHKIDDLLEDLNQTSISHNDLFARHEDILNKMEAAGLFKDDSIFLLTKIIIQFIVEANHQSRRRRRIKLMRRKNQILYLDQNLPQSSNNLHITLEI